MREKKVADSRGGSYLGRKNASALFVCLFFLAWGLSLFHRMFLSFLAWDVSECSTRASHRLVQT